MTTFRTLTFLELCFPQEQILYAQAQGAIGFILGRVDNFGGLGCKYPGTRDIHIPSVEISVEDFVNIKEILDSESQVTIDLVPGTKKKIM